MLGWDGDLEEEPWDPPTGDRRMLYSDVGAPATRYRLKAATNRSSKRRGEEDIEAFISRDQPKRRKGGNEIDNNWQ